MTDSRLGEPGVGQLRDLVPCESVLLAAAPQRSSPEIDNVVSEDFQCTPIGRHRMVFEEAVNNLHQPLPLYRDWLMHAPPQFLLDLLELRPHAVAPGFPREEELTSARLAANEGEAQKGEGLRFSDSASLAVARSKAPEFNDTGLVRMKGQRELLKSFEHCVEKPICVGLVLEPDNDVIGIPHDDHVAGGLSPPVAFGP